MEFEFTMLAKWPNLNRVEIPFGKEKTNVKVFDGEHLWELSSFQGDLLHDKEQTALAKLSSSMHGPIEWRKNYESVKTTGSELVDGKTAIVVLAKTKDGTEVRHSFDQESGLMVKTTMDRFQMPDSIERLKKKREK